MIQASRFLACIATLIVVPQFGFAQETTIPEEDIAGVIESDSRQDLEFFLDWVSVLPRVHADFEKQGIDEPPAELGDWAQEALRGLTAQGNRIVIPRAGVDQPVARLYAEMVFQVFYEGPFRDYCFENVNAELSKIQAELQRQQTESIAQLDGMSPDSIVESIAQARQQEFELQMERAESEARAVALSERIEARMKERQDRANHVPESIQQQRALAENLRQEIDRLQRQKEKLGTRETRDIEELQRRLAEMDISIAHSMDEWRARMDGGQQDLSHLRDMLVEAETNFLGMETRLRVLKERMAMLSHYATIARKLSEERVDLEARAEVFSRMYDRIDKGRLFGIQGLPQVRFR